MSAAAERSSPISALLPALLILAFALGLGTFSTALDAWRVAAGHGLLAVFALIGCRAGLDPLALGGGVRKAAPETPQKDRLGRYLPMLVVVAGIWPLLSAWASPVPRAGVEGILLLPALVFCVPAVAWLWRTPRRRRLGAAGLGAALALVAALALIAAGRDGGWLDGGRAALPLGHHNLLALWLVMLVPVAVLGAQSAGARHAAGSRRRLGRVVNLGRVINLGMASGLGVPLALAALLATRSLGGALALGALALATAWQGRSRNVRQMAILVALGLLAFAIPRLVRVVGGDDASARVRLGYLEAAVAGIETRPWRGWGPGASHWTLAKHMRPIPGVHPAGEVVADPHSLPFRLAYDLGLPGLLAIASLAFVSLRRRPALDPKFGFAAALGLAGFAVAATLTRPFAILAAAVTLAVLVGGRLAATEIPGAASAWGRRIAVAVVLTSASALIPLDAARIAYDRATRSLEDAEAVRALERAVALDPWHPLYRARLASLRGDRALADQAAMDAHGVSALWLAAGSSATVDPIGRRALARACVLDPLAPLPAYLLAVDGIDGDTGEGADAELAAALAGRALLAEPRLLAAVSWQHAPELRSRSIAWALDRDGVDQGWREALHSQAAGSVPRDRAQRALVVRADTDAAAAMSLHVFQRRPWPWRLASVAVDVEAVAAVSLPPASALSTTAREALEPRACRALSAW